MNLNGYEAKVLGINVYKALAKRCNMFTKSWSIGRYKYFKEELKHLMKNASKNHRKS